MDLKDIEAWGRELLEHEAAKRGMRSPEVYSRTELVRFILKHDYGAPRNVKEAARLIGGILGSAKQVLKKRLHPLQRPGVETYIGAATEAKWGGAASRRAGEEHAREQTRDGDATGDATRRDLEWSHVATTRASSADDARDRSLGGADALRDAERARAEARDVRLESERVRSDSRAAGQHDVEQPRPEPGWHRVRLGRDLPPAVAESAAAPGEAPPKEADTVAAGGEAPASDATLLQPAISEAARAGTDASAPHLRLLEPLPAAADEVIGVIAAAAEPVANATSAAESTEQLTYGPHPKDGMLLRWRVTSEAIERAQQLLGAKGELAVRIVAVRVEPHAVVKAEVIDHGPVPEAGDWIAPLLPTDGKYVSSIGMRSPTKFVSIVHAKS